MTVERWLAKWITILGFVLLAISAVAMARSAPAAAGSYGLAVTVFISQLVALALIIVGFGVLISKTLWGFALSSRYTYSLSKLQMAGWTIVVFATILTVAEIRILGYFGAVDNPLGFSIPGELLAAMGIAAFTTAATPAVLSLKSTTDVTNSQARAGAQRLADQTGASKEQMNNVGQVMVRTAPDLARWSDIVSGDEVANAGTVDLSKVQQLLITLLLLGVYIGAVVSAISSRSRFDDLPALSTQFVQLMAISHAGYLAYKVAPKAAADQPPGGGGTTQQGTGVTAMRGPAAAAPRPRD